MSDRQTNEISARLDAWTSPRDRRPIYEWARDNLHMPAVLTIRGAFDVHRSRHFIAPFEALADDRVRQVAICKPVRGGGTLISDIWHCWCRSEDPGPAMAVLQSDEIAKDHAESRLMPMLLSAPRVRGILPDDRHKKRTTEIMFRDGLPFYVTGPGINNLQTKGIRYMSLDEPWLYKLGIIAEAEGRLGDFSKLQTSKLLLTSQAGVEDDQFDLRCKDGNLARWNVQCQGCGKYFIPQWTGERGDGSVWGMRWDPHKDAGGRWLVSRCVESIRYECEHCGHPHIDGAKTKTEWNRTGCYQDGIATAPTRNRSFQWNALIDSPWVDLVAEYLGAINAKKLGIIEPIIQFFQKRMAEPKSEKTAMEGAVEFRRTAYDSTLVWPEERVRFITWDRQEEGLYWGLARAWSASGESRRLWFGKCYGAAEVEAKSRELNCINVFVDAGHEAKGPQGVYAMCARNDWVALKGSDKTEFVHSIGSGGRRRLIRRSYGPVETADAESGTSEQGRMVANLVLFSASIMADRVHGLIANGKWIEPAASVTDPMEREYKRQMGAEYKRKKMDPETGRTKWIWVCPSRNNHAFDCAKMQVLAATLADILPDQESEVTESTESVSPLPSTTP